jgi:hypothetical protein
MIRTETIGDIAGYILMALGAGGLIATAVWPLVSSRLQLKRGPQLVPLKTATVQIYNKSSPALTTWWKNTTHGDPNHLIASALLMRARESGWSVWGRRATNLKLIEIPADDHAGLALNLADYSLRPYYYPDKPPEWIDLHVKRNTIKKALEYYEYEHSPK